MHPLDRHHRPPLELGDRRLLAAWVIVTVALLVACLFTLGQLL